MSLIVNDDNGDNTPPRRPAPRPPSTAATTFDPYARMTSLPSPPPVRETSPPVAPLSSPRSPDSGSPATSTYRLPGTDSYRMGTSPLMMHAPSSSSASSSSTSSPSAASSAGVANTMLLVRANPELRYNVGTPSNVHVWFGGRVVCSKVPAHRRMLLGVLVLWLLTSGAVQGG